MAAAIFLTVARMAARPGRPFDAALLGLLAGLAVLSKGTALVLVPVCLGASWHFGARNTSSRARDVLLCGAVALAVCGPWLWRNQTLYGDPLALGAISERFRFIASRVENFRGVPADTYVRALSLVLFCTFWGIGGGPNTALTLLNPFGSRGPIGLLRLGAWTTFGTLLLLLSCALACACALLGLLRAFRNASSWPQPAKRALAWWALGILLVAGAWLRFNFVQFQGQARYFHPPCCRLLSLFAMGWRELWGRRVHHRFGPVRACAARHHALEHLRLAHSGMSGHIARQQLAPAFYDLHFC
jgi:hypothetical protein